jgi:hypothetical protein
MHFPTSKYCTVLFFIIVAVVASGFHTIAELGLPIYKSTYFKYTPPPETLSVPLSLVLPGYGAI